MEEYSEKHLLELTRAFAEAYSALPFMSQAIALRYNTLSGVLMKQGVLAITPEKFDKGIILVADYIRNVADVLEFAGRGNFDGIPALNKSMQSLLDEYNKENEADNDPPEVA